MLDKSVIREVFTTVKRKMYRAPAKCIKYFSPIHVIDDEGPVLTLTDVGCSSYEKLQLFMIRYRCSDPNLSVDDFKAAVHDHLRAVLLVTTCRDIDPNDPSVAFTIEQEPAPQQNYFRVIVIKHPKPKPARPCKPKKMNRPTDSIWLL